MMVVSLSMMYFILCNIQFWVSDYLIYALGFKSDLVAVSFTVICVTSPTAGVISSGIIGAKIGGFESKYTMPLIIFFGVIATTAGMLVPFFETYWPIVISLWIYLYTGGCMLTLMLGV